MATVALSGIITPTNVVTAASTTTLTNKTISGASNTLTNIPLSTGVTGTLPIANGGTNSTATPTAGTVPYGTGTAFAFTSAGTSGQLLQSNGASAPTWVTASAGAMVLLQTVTASSSSTVDLETGIGSTYDAYVIMISGWVTLSGLYVSLKIGGSYQTDAYYNSTTNNSMGSSSGVSLYVGNSKALFAFGIAIMSVGDLQGNATIHFNSPTSTTLVKQITFTGVSLQDGGLLPRTTFGVGNYQNLTSALTGVRFKSGSGSITSGTFSLYGITK